MTAQSLTRIRNLSLFTIGLLALAFGGLTLWLAHNRAYDLVHPQHVPVDCALETVGVADYQAVSFSAADGVSLRGWYAPPQNGAVILLVHGHGGNRCELLPEAGVLAAAGYGFLLFDTRGAGESAGNTVTFGLSEVNDVEGAFDFVAAQPAVDAHRIGVFGHSQGAATVILAGARLPHIRAVIAESGYTSLQDNVNSGVKNLVGLPPFPFGPLIVFFGQQEAGLDITQVRPIDVVADISPRPVLFIHGALDRPIPVENAYQLYAAAQEPKELYVMPDAGHCCFLEIGGSAYAQKIITFFDGALDL